MSLLIKGSVNKKQDRVISEHPRSTSTWLMLDYLTFRSSVFKEDGYVYAMLSSRAKVMAICKVLYHERSAS